MKDNIVNALFKLRIKDVVSIQYPFAKQFSVLFLGSTEKQLDLLPIISPFPARREGDVVVLQQK